MNQLFGKMRQLSIQSLKERREEIFERTRQMMLMDENGTYDEQSYQETENGFSMSQPIAMEEEPPFKNNNKKKKQDENNRIRRYWRKLLQVTDWMLEIPDNLREFYVAARPDGNKCLAIFKGYHLQLRDKSGGLLGMYETKSKVYDRSIFEAYYSRERGLLVLSDLIAWKDNPMTSSEFQFRYSWLISNLNLGSLRAWTGLDITIIRYLPCNCEGLRQAYSGASPYEKEGLLFVHKDSFYLHGLNPNVMVWKDPSISKYLLGEIEESRLGSKGIGFLNKYGEVKTIEHVSLFSIDRSTIDPSHRFIRFTYRDISIENLEDDKVRVHFSELKTVDSLKNYNGPIDSLGKLLFKCRVGVSNVKIEQIAGRCSQTEIASQ